MILCGYHIGRMSGNRQGNPPSPTPAATPINSLATSLRVSKSSLGKLAREGRVSEQEAESHWRFHRGTIDNWLPKLGEGDSQI